MKSVLTLSLLVAVATAGPLVPLMPFEELEGRIANGELAKAGQFPYQVGLRLVFGNSGAWCGGTLISNSWILTAAHCTDGVDGAVAFLGAIDIKNNDEEGQRRIYIPKSNIIVHADYDKDTYNNDISLIKLPIGVEFNERIQPATLPKKTGQYSTYEGDMVWTSGWGRNNDSSTASSNLLHYIEVPVLNQLICKIFYFDAINDNMICVSGRNGKSPCKGDSGGPLVYKDNGVNYVIGVTSFGITLGCEKGWPGVFARVTSYLDWIEETSGVVNK